MKLRIFLALSLLLSILLLAASGQQPGAAAPSGRAQSAILFLGDGMGLSTVNAASSYGYKRAGALFIQSLPYLGFSDTSSADNWVSDSAAGMTAIVTGRKTLNGVISQAPEGAVLGKEDGPALQTLLEYAEQKGLSTGIITNDEVTGATPAACYAHSNSRNKRLEIAAQFVGPRFGDGADLLIGPDQGYLTPLEQGGKRTDSRDIAEEAGQRGYQRFNSAADFLAAALSGRAKVLGLFKGPFEPEPVVEKAIAILSRNPRGYFLMVEWDSHKKTAKESLDNALAFDRSVALARKLTDPRRALLVVTADHSYDLRFSTSGKLDADILPAIRIEGHHTAEEVLLAAGGPGASRVRGFMKNTDIFEVIKAAFGW